MDLFEGLFAKLAAMNHDGPLVLYTVPCLRVWSGAIDAEQEILMAQNGRQAPAQSPRCTSHDWPEHQQVSRDGAEGRLGLVSIKAGREFHHGLWPKHFREEHL